MPSKGYGLEATLGLQVFSRRRIWLASASSMNQSEPPEIFQHLTLKCPDKSEDEKNAVSLEFSELKIDFGYIFPFGGGGWIS